MSPHGQSGAAPWGLYLVGHLLCPKMPGIIGEEGQNPGAAV